MLLTFQFAISVDAPSHGTLSRQTHTRARGCDIHRGSEISLSTHFSLWVTAPETQGMKRFRPQGVKFAIKGAARSRPTAAVAFYLKQSDRPGVNGFRISPSIFSHLETKDDARLKPRIFRCKVAGKKGIAENESFSRGAVGEAIPSSFYKPERGAA